MTEHKLEGYEATRVVGFIDILGFASLVEAAHLNPTMRQGIVEALRRVQQTQAIRHQSTDLSVHYFSDSIIISAPDTAEGFWTLVLATDSLTWSLLNLGTWVRGGITLGGAYVSDDIVFGTGINNAYRLESSIACFPRIVFGKSAMRRADDHAAKDTWARDYRNQLLRRDVDGVWFLDFLRDYARLNRDHNLNSNPAVEDLAILQQGQMIKTMIQERLDGMVDQPAVFAKGKWLADYWNATVVGNRFEPPLFLKSISAR